MTLWFDVSDLCTWTEPQLTGIQRTVLAVLTELMNLRNDVRLFRCHARGLSAVERAELPWRWTETSGPQRTGACGFKPPWQQRAARLVRRHAGQTIATLLARARDLPARLQAAAPRRGLRPLLPTQLFSAGDACVSLSATWQFPRYGQLIAGQKASAPIGCVNLLYDLVPCLFPQWSGAHHRRRFAIWARHQIENADLILAISQFQRTEIERFMHANDLPAKPIATIRLGDSFGPRRAGAPPAPRTAPGGPFVLCVSTIDARKNHACLHRAWRRLAAERPQDCPKLLLIGMAHASGAPALRAIRNDPAVNGLIVHIADAGDAELDWYYRNCLFTVYPSLYEGWGLPVRESLAAGRYCIASNTSSLTEAGGDLAGYFDPAHEAACFELIHRAVAQPEFVKRREQEIKASFEPHSWGATALRISRLADETSAQVLAAKCAPSARARTDDLHVRVR